MRAIRSFVGRGMAAAGWRLTGFADRLRAETPPSAKTLVGDRVLEWSWCLAHLPASPGLVLDFGAGNGILSAGAVLGGHRVVAVDLEACAFEFALDRVDYRHGDFNELEFEPRSFDYVLNCSTIEHVGLAGRYSGSHEETDADLRAMKKLASLLKPGGTMALTAPVGRDGVFPPFHRVYGSERLPRLLSPFAIVTERYMAKQNGPRWQEVDREIALAEEGSASYYALGLFRLVPA